MFLDVITGFWVVRFDFQIDHDQYIGIEFS